MEMPKPIIRLILTVFYGIIAFGSFGQYTLIKKVESKTNLNKIRFFEIN